MDTYDTDRDTLEDVLYRRLQLLWDPFTDALEGSNDVNLQSTEFDPRR